MSTEPTEPDRAQAKASRAFGRKIVAFVLVGAVFAWGMSFLVVPVIEGRTSGIDAFTAICRAIGIGGAKGDATAQRATVPASSVNWTTATLFNVRHGDAVAGAALAQDTCVACHSPNGLTADPTTIPSTTGLSARVIYKQLQDIKSGARTNDAMKPILEDVTDQQMTDLAAYYSGLPRRNSDIRTSQTNTGAAALVQKGDAARALPPCAACHDLRGGGPLEAPVLAGQYPDYIARQLHAYASRERRNDLYARMRVIAAKLTDREIQELADYYAAN